MVDQIWHQIKKINQKIMGLIYFQGDSPKDFAYTLVEENKEIRALPFYFDPNSYGGEIVLSMGSDAYSVNNLETVKFENFVPFFNTRLTNYLRQIKENPKKLKDSVKNFMGTLDFFQFELSSVFTESVKFKFPEPLLATVKAFPNIPYEICGGISISKFKSKYNYDLILHADKPDTCSSPQGFIREIHFHSHPNRTQDKKKYTEVLEILTYLRDLVSFPSLEDYKALIQTLTKNYISGKLIFTPLGIFYFRNQTIKPYQGQTIYDLEKSEEIIKELTREKYDKYIDELSISLMVALIAKYKSPEFSEFSELIKNPSSGNSKTELTNKMVNLLNEFSNISKNLEKILKENGGQKLITDWLNQKILSLFNLPEDEKIIGEFIIGYDSLKIEVYPKILGYKGVPETRRLTFSK